MRLVSVCLVLAVATVPGLSAQQGRLVTETEPNDDVAHANLIQLGDTISGTKVYNNRDYFAFDLPAGAKLLLSVPSKDFCAAIAFYDRDGRTIQSKDCLYDTAPPDTLRVRISAAGRYYAAIWHPSDIQTPGDEGRVYHYKLRLGLYEPPALGDGNPMARVATDFGEIMAMAAAPNGDMVVVDYAIDGYMRPRLKRVTPEGQVTTFASDVNATGQVAIDAFGDLLVPSGDQGGVVWRYNLQTGARTIFTGPPAGPHPYYGVTIGADGDVWLSTPGGSEGAKFSRFDALGTFKSEVAAGARTFWLTTAQNGELFFMAQDSGTVYRLANNTTPVRLITPASWMTGYGNPVGMGGVVLDRDGWVYLYQPRQGKLLLFDAQYQLARDPLAQVLDSVGWKEEHIGPATPAWVRNPNGTMTARLLVTRAPGLGNETPGPREILEVNSRGMGAPGADPGLHVDRASLRGGSVTLAYADTLRLAGGSAGNATWSVVFGALPDGVTLMPSGVLTGTPSRSGTFDFAVRAASGSRAGFGRFSMTVGNAPPAQVSIEEIVDALIGETTLSADAVRQLDDLGNRNGRLDLGDLRAFLRAHGQLTGRSTP